MAEAPERALFHFRLIITVISGLLGIRFLKLIENIEIIDEKTGALLTIAIGLLLFITAFLQIKQKNS